MRKVYMVWIVILSMYVACVSSSAWAVRICLAKTGCMGDWGACSCGTCIDDVIGGKITDERDTTLGDDTNYDALSMDIAANPARATVQSNANTLYKLPSSLAYSSSTIMATKGEDLLLKDGTSASFDNCSVNASVPTQSEQIYVNGNQVTVTAYQGNAGTKIYSCTGQTIGGNPSIGNAARIYIDGLVQEFKCNVEKTIGTLLTQASRIFVLLFLIEFGWAAATWVGDGGRDLQNFVKNLVRKFMFYGFFYWLLLNTQPTKFFEDGSWVGQTILSMENFAYDIIDGGANGPSVLNDMKMAAGTGVQDITQAVQDGTIYIYDTNGGATAPPGCLGSTSYTDPACRQARLGLSPATIMLYGFSLMAAILSAVAQGILFNLPAIIAGLIIGFFTGGFVTTYVIRFLVIFIFLGIIASFIALLSMVFIGGQILIAMIEMYMICGLAVIFMGFGGSRWTVDTVVKYMGYVLITGVKLIGLMVVFVVTVLTIHAWVSRLMGLASGGAGNPVSAVLDSINPVKMVLRIFEAMMVYISITIQSFVLFGLVMRSADFTTNLMGGNPILSAGQMMKAGAAGVTSAMQMANGTTRVAGHAASAAGGLLGNATQALGGMGSHLKASFNAGAAGAHPPEEAEENAAGHNGVHAPEGGGGGALPKAPPPKETRVSKFTGQDKDWSEKNAGQKALTGAGVAVMLPLGATAGLLKAPHFLVTAPAKGVGAVTQQLTDFNPERSKKVGKGMAKYSGLAKAAYELGKLNPKTQTDGQKFGFDKLVAEGAAGKTSAEEKAKEKGKGKLNGGLKKAGRLYAFGMTMGLSEAAIALKKMNDNRKAGKGEHEPDGAKKAKTSLSHKVLGVLAAPAGLRDGMQAKIYGGKYGTSKDFKGGYQKGRDARRDTLKKQMGIKKNAETGEDEGGLKRFHNGATADKENMFADFTRPFGDEKAEKVIKNKGQGDLSVKSIDRDKGMDGKEKKGVATITLKDGRKFEAEQYTFGGGGQRYKGTGDYEGHSFRVTKDSDGKPKKLEEVQEYNTGPKAYQTLLGKDGNISQAYNAFGGSEGGSKALLAGGTVAVLGGAVAGTALLGDGLRGTGNLLKGLTSNDGFFGKTTKSVGDKLGKIVSNPLMADRAAEGYMLKPAFSAPDDDD